MTQGHLVSENGRDVFGQKMVSLNPNLLQALTHNQLLVISTGRYVADDTAM